MKKELPTGNNLHNLCTEYFRFYSVFRVCCLPVSGSGVVCTGENSELILVDWRVELRWRELNSCWVGSGVGAAEESGPPPLRL